MNAPQIITLITLLVTILFFVKEWLPVGLTALLAALFLVLTGVLEPERMRGLLAHQSVVAVGAMFVISGGLSRTGALSFLGELFLRQAGKGRRRIVAFMMLLVAALSSVVNNTTIVLVFLPIILSVCERLEHPPSRYLIPLSFASMFGGMATLIGTSTNIVVADLGREAAQRIGQTFDPGMGSFLPVGLVFIVFGVVYMSTVGVRLLPDRVALSMTLKRGALTEYVTEACIAEGGALVGKSLLEVKRRFPGLRILQLVRLDVIEASLDATVLRPDDLLLVKGEPSQIIDLRSAGGMRLLPDVEDQSAAREVGVTLAEVIVPPRSRWIGRKVGAIGFRQRYGVAVVALQRHGHHIRQKVGELRVEPADMLLVQGTAESLRNLRASDNLILVEGVEQNIKLRGRAPLALAGLLTFVGLVSMDVADVGTAALISASWMVVGRCITFQEAFNTVDWNVLFTLGGSLALGVAVENVGLARDAALFVATPVAEFGGPLLLLAITYLVTTILTDSISNGSAAALMVPVVVQAANVCDCSVEPFLMGVAFAASAAFLSPVGYQTNLLVYGPGGYRFSDFVRVGLPLRLLFWAVAVAVIPLVHPF